jgi:hypothetical protein
VQSCTTFRHFNNQTKVLAQQRRGKSSSCAISPKIISDFASSAAPSSKRSVRKRAVSVAFDCSERVAKRAHVRLQRRVNGMRKGKQTCSCIALRRDANHV